MLDHAAVDVVIVVENDAALACDAVICTKPLCNFQGVFRLADEPDHIGGLLSACAFCPPNTGHYNLAGTARFFQFTAAVPGNAERRSAFADYEVPHGYGFTFMVIGAVDANIRLGFHILDRFRGIHRGQIMDCLELDPGKLKRASTMDSSTTLEVTRYLVEIDGVTVIDIDKYAGRYYVDGEDILAEVNALI